MHLILIVAATNNSGHFMFHRSAALYTFEQEASAASAANPLYCTVSPSVGAIACSR
jgi:hypothetical protein